MARVIVVHADASSPITLAEASLKDILPAVMPDILVCVGDQIDTDMQEGFLRYGHQVLSSCWYRQSGMTSLRCLLQSS